MRGAHCGEHLSAFVDGELGHRERDRVLAHLATCPACRAEAEALRAIKGRLRTLDAPLPADLTVTLLGMKASYPPHRAIRPPFPPGRTAAPPDNRPPSVPRVASRIGHRGARYTAIGMLSAAVAVGAMLVLNEGQDVPDVAPQLSELGPQHNGAEVSNVPTPPREVVDHGRP